MDDITINSSQIPISRNNSMYAKTKEFIKNIFSFFEDKDESNDDEHNEKVVESLMFLQLIGFV